MLALILTGLLTGLSLIIAIGAQNAFVLRQGLTRRHVGIVVAICITADIGLITLGVAGVGAAIAGVPALLTALQWAGAAYLIWYGVRSLLAARHAVGLRARSAPVRSVVSTALALTFLNPHVYLDTVLMLGNLANQHGPTGRWWFALGAYIASTAWFSLLGLGAHTAASWIARPAVWRVLDVFIGLTMISIAILLLTG